MIKIVAEPMKEQIRQALAEEIRHGSGGYVDRLPPVKQLAERFGTSVFTIQGALELLARDQLVVKVHGSGTYLTERFQAASLKESVALCLNPSGHLNAEFLSLLARQAQRAGLVPLIIDCGGSEVEAMRQLALSGTRFFLVHGTMHFNPGALGDPALRDKHVVAVLDWQLSPPGTLLHMALSDSRAGSEAQARHLAGRGVRRALYVFSGGHQAWMENQAIPDAEKSLTMPRDFHFLRACRELGIEIDTIESCQTSPLQLDLDAEAFRRLFSGAGLPPCDSGRAGRGRRLRPAPARADFPGENRVGGSARLREHPLEPDERSRHQHRGSPAGGGGGPGVRVDRPAARRPHQNPACEVGGAHSGFALGAARK